MNVGSSLQLVRRDSLPSAVYLVFYSDLTPIPQPAESWRGKLGLDQRREHGDKKKGISAIFAKVPPSCARTLLPKRRRKKQRFLAAFLAFAADSETQRKIGENYLWPSVWWIYVRSLELQFPASHAWSVGKTTNCGSQSGTEGGKGGGKCVMYCNIIYCNVSQYHTMYLYVI